MIIKFSQLKAMLGVNESTPWGILATTSSESDDSSNIENKLSEEPDLEDMLALCKNLELKLH